MKRVALLVVTVMMIISLAAPPGAVFASEGEEGVVSDDLVSVDMPAPASIEGDDEEVEGPSAQDPAAPMDTQPPVIPPPPLVLDIVQPTPLALPESPLIITAYKATGAHLHAVQFYNTASSMQQLDGYELMFVAGDIEYPIMLPSGWLKPRSHMVLAWQGESVAADGEFVLPVGGEAATAQQMVLRRGGVQPHSVTIAPGYKGELLHRFKSAAGNYTTNTTFSVGAETVLSGGLYTLPDTPGLAVLEVLVNPRDCTYGQELEGCYDYVKVKNTGEEPLDLSLYRLRSGYSNASSSASNTSYLSGVMAPDEVRTITHDRDGKRVSFTANDGTVWLEDVYGYVSFDLGVPPYVGSDKAAQVGRSWAYNPEADVWQWATPAPRSIENDFTPAEGGKGSGGSTLRELVPCRDDQYRSEETNRCRTIAATRTLTPCREGQYRSEETNRCRSIAAAASALKPCADDQFRNPTTNRCKKIASSDDVALADCGEGRERNPATNRCRSILASAPPPAGFAVEPVAEPASVFIGWWVLGGIALAAVAYAGWEWREEIGRTVRRILPVTRSRR